MTDKELAEILEDRLRAFPALNAVAPGQWVAKSGSSIQALIDFQKDRKDYFRINLPMTVWQSANPQADERGGGFCRGALHQLDDFCKRYAHVPSAKKKVSEIFDPDWSLQDTKFMSILSELCLIYMLSLKENMTLVDFDVPLSVSKAGQEPKNADIKMMVDGKDVFIDVKAPTLTGANLDPRTFRTKFETFSVTAFNEKFDCHKIAGVHRIVAYIYKFANNWNDLFHKNADHLRPHNIPHASGDTGFAQIYWTRLVRFEDESRRMYLLDNNYDETDLMNDLKQS